MFLAINEIIKEKSRFILITMVIILVSYLVFFLTSLAYGLASSYTRSLDGWQASGIILNKNANSNIGRSLLFEDDYKKLLDSQDVALLGFGSATLSKEKSEDVALFGLDSASFISPTVSSGRPIAEANEVLASSELAPIGVGLGDEITLQGASTVYKVVGIVDGSTFQTAPVIYMTLDTWRSAVSEVSGMSGMRDESTVSAVVTRGEYSADFSSNNMGWLSSKEFIFALPGYQAQVLTFGLMIGFLIGIMAFVLAIFIYILTMQKKAIFGVLKAEGVPSSYIARSVMVQVIVLSTFGLVVGMILVFLTGIGLSGKVPFAVNPIFYAGISGLFLLCASIGGIASVRSVVKIDPVEAMS